MAGWLADGFKELGLSFLVGLADSRRAKGALGEHRTGRAMRRGLPAGSVVFQDLLLPTRRGTAQVDHVVFAPSGAWTVETKNWSMEVHGLEADRHWAWYAGWCSGWLLNPVLQARRHALVVANAIGVPVRAAVALAGPGPVYTDSLAVLGQPDAAAGVIARAPQELGWSPDEARRLATLLEGVALPNTRKARARHRAFCCAARTC